MTNGVPFHKALGIIKAAMKEYDIHEDCDFHTSMDVYGCIVIERPASKDIVISIDDGEYFLRD